MMPNLGFFLEAWTNYRATGNEADVVDVVTDSREARSGSLFIAIIGERADGHDYVAQAFENGAVAALVSRPLAGDYQLIDTRDEMIPDPIAGGRYLILLDDPVAAIHKAAKSWRDQFELRVIGITGSVGKTSTKELTHAVLSTRFRTFKTPGNRNSILGMPPALFDLRPYHQRAVVEMGMYTMGEIAELCALTRPLIGVITMIDAVHMERAGSLENIVSAKQELVEALPADGVAVLNRDEPLVMGMAAHTKAQVITYGIDEGADLWASDIESMGLNGIRFVLHSGNDALHLHVPLLGRHSVHTVLRAAAVGRVEGLDWEEIIAGLQSGHAQLRIVTATGPEGALILDDTYNASPASMIAALNLLEDFEGRRIAVLGDMLELGDAEEASHRLVGRRAALVADILVTVGRLGRIIGEEALAAGMAKEDVRITSSMEQAATLLQEMVAGDDTILIKGSRAVRLDELVSLISRPEYPEVVR